MGTEQEAKSPIQKVATMADLDALEGGKEVKSVETPTPAEGGEGGKSQEELDAEAKAQQKKDEAARIAAEGETPEAKEAREKEEAKVIADAKVKADAEAERIKKNAEGRSPTEIQAELDAITEKGKTEGIDKLTDEEKQKLVDAKILVPEEEAGANKTTPTDSATIKQEIEKLTGEELDIDIAKHALDTPKGIVEYLKKSNDSALDKFEAELKTKYPDSYRAMQIEAEGGSVKEYFVGKEPSTKDYTKAVLGEENPAQYKEIIKASYTMRGIDEATINDIIKLAEDSNTLKEKATPELAYIQKTQLEQREVYAKQMDSRKEANQQVINAMSAKVSKITETGTIGKFVIPENDKKNFDAHLKDNIHFQNGKFYMTKEVTDENMDNLLATEFFAYKKGDLKSLVEREANSKLVFKLKENAGKANAGHTFVDTVGKEAFVALGDL